MFFHNKGRKGTIDHNRKSRRRPAVRRTAALRVLELERLEERLPLAISVSDVAPVPEGNTGDMDDAVFNVLLSAASVDTVTVQFATADGTATAPGDYSSTSGTLTFMPGETSKAVSVTVLGDIDDEPHETFSLNISGATNDTIDDGQGQATILDDDGPPPAVSAGDASATEGNSVVFPITLSESTGSQVVVRVNTTSGTATGDVDYNQINSFFDITFQPGESSATVSVASFQDSLDEPNETFSLNILMATGASVADAEGIGTILDDDPTPVVNVVDPAAVPEGDTGAMSIVFFTVLLTGASASDVTVQFATQDNTAAAPGDYTPTSGTLTFASGETSKSVAVTVLGDTDDEASETFFLTVSNATSATLGDAQGTATILDDDGPLPIASVGDASATEGDNVVFPITLSEPTGLQVVVRVNTTSGTATGDVDYNQINSFNDITFAPGETSKSVSVQTFPDTLGEGNETFLMHILQATNASVGDSEGTGTIVDEDPPPDLSVTKTDTPDPVVAGTNLTYTLTVSNAGPSDALDVDLTDIIPANTTFVSAMQTTGPMFTLMSPPVGGTGTFTASIDTFTAGSTATFTLVVNVNANVLEGSVITNTANVSSITTDPTPTDNSATETTDVEAEADLSVTKDDSPDPVLAGNNLSFTILVGNNGPSDAQTVALTDVIPANTTFVSAMQNSGPTFMLMPPPVGGTGTFTASIATLAAGASATFTLVVNVNANTPDGAIISNTANISSSTTDTSLTNNTDTENTDVETEADLSVTKTDLPDPVSPGANLTYTITLANDGPSDAQNPSLSDIIPAGTTFVSAMQASGPMFSLMSPPVGGTGTFTATAATLAAGVTATFTLVVNVNGSTPHNTIVTNTVTASSTTTDPDLTNNADTETTSAQFLITIDNVSVAESTANAVFTVTLSAPSTTAVTVQFATAGGTATSGSDFTSTSGTLTFAIGETTQAVTVPILNDTLDEADETFTVNLSAALGAAIADSSGLGTIQDNDPPPALAITDVTVTEGADPSALFAVSLSTASGLQVTVAFATSGVSATSGSDFTATSGTLTFGPGETTKTVTVPILNDTLDEPDETFVVNLSGATNATLPDSQGLGTIIDNDPPPSLSIGDVTVTEGTDPSALFTVSLSTASGQQVTVAFATSAGTAAFGLDFQPTSGTLTFAAGETAKTVTVAILNDSLDEANETFHVDLSAAVNATISDTQGVGTIVDDDPAPNLSINSITVNEGDTGLGDAVFTVTLSSQSGQSVMVVFATADGTATAGLDYQPTSGTLSFAPGQTTQRVTVKVVGDLLLEPNETFSVVLSAPLNANLSTSTGTGTIQDDEVDILVSGADAGGGPHVRVFEAANGQVRFEFFAFEAGFTGGVRVATGDVNGDGRPDIIAAAGPGGGPHVRVFDGQTGQPLPGQIGSFFAFDIDFSGGVHVAAGDFNADNRDDIVIGGGPGADPQVRVFSGATGLPLAGFDAFLHPSFNSEVRVAVADINGDGPLDIIAAAGGGPGNQPHVQVFSHLSGTPISHPLGSFLAYNAAFSGGVYVAAGDVNGDGRADLLTGPGAGGGPHVKAFSGIDGSIITQFFAYDAAFTGGVRVAAADRNSDGRADIITGAGPGGTPHVRIFDGITAAPLDSFFAYNPAFNGGVFVAGSLPESPSPLPAQAQSVALQSVSIIPPARTRDAGDAFEDVDGLLSSLDLDDFGLAADAASQEELVDLALSLEEA